MLANNPVFQKLLTSDEKPKPTFDKKCEWRNKEDLSKLKHYFKDLKVFESLKKESEVDDDVIHQCFKDFKYRKYEAGQNIIKYGDEGDEFYLILKGSVAIYTPKPIEKVFRKADLADFVQKNKENIIWDRNSKYILEIVDKYLQFQASQPKSGFGAAMRRALLKKFLGENHDKDELMIYEFLYLTQVASQDEGQGFGELALMGGTAKRPEKRAATVKSQTELHLAVLGKDDFTKVLGQAMQKKLDAKVEFFKNFRISEGISRTNLHKLSYYLKEKQFRRRDIVYREGDPAELIYFVKEGEFEITKKLTTKLDKNAISKGSQSLAKQIEVKVSIIGPNQIIGLEDMISSNKTTYRNQKVECISEKAFVYYLTKEEYFVRFYKQLQKHVIVESRVLKEPFFQQRLNSLKKMATKESIQWLQQKERFLSREQISPDGMKECKKVVDQVQNEELCSLLLNHKLLKRPQIRIERITSKDPEESINDFDPNHYSNKDYFLKMSRLYNQFVFKTTPFSHQSNNSPDIKEVKSPNEKTEKVETALGSKHNSLVVTSSLNQNFPPQLQSQRTVMGSKSVNLFNSGIGDKMPIMGQSLMSPQPSNYNNTSGLKPFEPMNSTGNIAFKIQPIKPTQSILAQNQNIKQTAEEPQKRRRDKSQSQRIFNDKIQTAPIMNMKQIMMSPPGNHNHKRYSIGQENTVEDLLDKINEESNILHQNNLQNSSHDLQSQQFSKPGSPNQPIFHMHNNQSQPNLLTSMLEAGSNSQALNQKTELKLKTQKSQSLIRTNNKNNNRNSTTKKSLSIETIQAHLMQSQNSLLQMLEQRLKLRQAQAERQKQLQELNDQSYSQKEKQMTHVYKTSERPSPQKKKICHKLPEVYREQLALSQLQQEPSLTQAKKARENAVIKSNIYLNMFITSPLKR